MRTLAMMMIGGLVLAACGSVDMNLRNIVMQGDLDTRNGSLSNFGQLVFRAGADQWLAAGGQSFTDVVVDVTVVDDDVLNLNVVPTALALTEGGAPGSFDVSLTQQPPANTTVTIAPSVAGIVTLGSALGILSQVLIDFGMDSTPAVIFTLVLAMFTALWFAVTRRRDRELLAFEADLGMLWAGLTFWLMVSNPGDAGEVLGAMLPIGAIASVVGGLVVATGGADAESEELPERLPGRLPERILEAQKCKVTLVFSICFIKQTMFHINHNGVLFHFFVFFAFSHKGSH